VAVNVVTGEVVVVVEVVNVIVVVIGDVVVAVVEIGVETTIVYKRGLVKVTVIDSPYSTLAPRDGATSTM